MSAPARVCTAIALTVLTVVPFVSARQQTPPPQRATGTLNEGVTAVLVDVVVRDKRGQPVRDLSESDFEVLEDGVVQKIGSFTPVFDGVIHHDAAAVATPSAASGTESRPAIGSAAPVAAGPGVTALVFHGLSPDGRRRAVQAARSYIGDKEETENYIGVFGVELSLTPLVPFTRNGIAVRQALAKMASGVTAGFNSPEQQQQKTSAAQAAGTAAEAARAATAAAGAGNTGAVGTAVGDAQLAMMQARMLDTFQTMEHDQQGYIAMDALFAIVNTLGRLPGRKSLVLFSEGLSIPPDVHRLFLGVIDAANRANVSIYTMDAAGLRAQSEQAMVGDRVNQMAGAGTGILGESGGGGGGGALTKELENNEYVLRQDPASGLGQLAQETGGIAFNNTNNLRPAFERIESDQRNYYLLGYTPIKTQFDGRFRTIQVRVKRSGLTVAARKGYFAVRDPGGAPVNAWEAPALGALEQKPVPNAFPVRAGALLFPERGRPGLVPVVVELATAPLTFQPTEDGKSYTSDFTVLVRFLDGDDQVARKVSQHYEIRGELAQMDGAKRGEVVFYRESELPAGLYTMETVVYDALSGKSSVRFSTVEVPAFKEGTLRMSTLVLVKRGEQVPESERRADNPLLVNGVALSPNLGDPVSKAAKEAAFYFTIYPAAGGRTPDVMIELLLNGQIAARVPMPVPPPDASGRIQQLGRLPIEQLPPGTYDLRAVVQQGDQRVSRSTLLRITE